MSTLVAVVLVVGFANGSPAHATGTSTGPIALGDAASFAVLGATKVTDTNSSKINGSVGVSPGPDVVEGVPLMVVSNGLIHKADEVAARAKVSAQAAYDEAESRTSPQVVAADLSSAGPDGGNTLAPGVYSSAPDSSLGLTGTLILDGGGNPNAVFIFQAGSTLTTASSSKIELLNGAQAANVFWQIGSSATLGTNSTFVGTIVAHTSVTSTTAVEVDGRLLALNGDVTMDGGKVTIPVTVPGVPTGVSAVAGNTEAVVSWTAPANTGGSLITGYTVTSSGGQTATVSGTKTSVTVTGLTNGTAYTFTVTATNVSGTSAASDSSTAVTPATVPGVPTGVSAVAGNTEAVVSWTAPANTGGSLITGYTVTSSGGQTATVSGTKTSVTVTGLTNGTAYTFTVTATNVSGTSAASDSSTAVTPAITPAITPTVSLVLNFLAGSNIGDAVTTVSASNLKVGSDFSLVMRSTPVIVHSGVVGLTGAVNWRDNLPTGVPAGAHSLTLYGVAPDGAVLTAVAWFSYKASGEIVESSRIGPVADPMLTPAPVREVWGSSSARSETAEASPIGPVRNPTLRSAPDPVLDPALDSSLQGAATNTEPFGAWVEAAVARDPSGVGLGIYPRLLTLLGAPFWVYPGLLALLTLPALLGIRWWWLIAARRRRKREEEELEEWYQLAPSASTVDDDLYAASRPEFTRGS